MRGGQTPDQAQIYDVLARRGLLSRILGPVARRVDKPWKMYPVGILFGLGFDTATTIALFVVGGTAAPTAPWFIVLVLPILPAVSEKCLSLTANGNVRYQLKTESLGQVFTGDDA